MPALGRQFETEGCALTSQFVDGISGGLFAPPANRPLSSSKGLSLPDGAILPMQGGVTKLPIFDGRQERVSRTGIGVCWEHSRQICSDNLDGT